MTTFGRMFVVSCWVVAIVLACGSAVHANPHAGSGLIRAVDLATNTLVLDTRVGAREVRVAPTATIRDDHGATLSIRDLAPGDAVAYEMASDTVAILRVTRQFWAVPDE